jgi:enamine deaminase RidA (YjgF/YER057c/UK114 family)
MDDLIMPYWMAHRQALVVLPGPCSRAALTAVTIKFSNMRSLALLLAIFLFPLTAGKKKETTQILELPKEPPPAITAETRNLVFQVAPLSNKGLLTQQTKDAMKALLKLNAGSTIIKIRAFVAGAGDMRRVPAIVSEVLTDKKMPLPVVSVVQAGGLPLAGAQVVLESISAGKREVNPNGIVFIAGQSSSSENPLAPTLPLAEKSVAGLDKAMAGLSNSVLQVTCFTTSLDETPKIQSLLSSHYPSAAIDVVVMQRAAPRSVVDCEATARTSGPHTVSLEILSNGQSAAVSSAKLVFSGTQMAFGFDDKDARLAFQRLDKALEPLGASTKSVAMVNYYPLSSSIAGQVRRISAEFLDSKHSPAGTLNLFEGLPAMEASFALDVAAVVDHP